MLAAPVAFAQLTGDLQANVADATNAAVPNDTMTVNNLETSPTRTAPTGGFGSISISHLAVGDYEITVSHEGFITAKTRAAVAGGTSSTVAVVRNVFTAAQHNPPRVNSARTTELWPIGPALDAELQFSAT